MLISQKNPTYLYVVNTANGFLDGQERSSSELPVGAIMLSTSGNGTGTGGQLVSKSSIAATTTPFQFFFKDTNGEIKVSPAFKYADIVSKNTAAYSAPTQQVSYVGATSDTNVTGFGTDSLGNANIVIGNNYSMMINLEYTKTVVNNASFLKPVNYLALSTSQADLATGFYDSFLRTFVREPFNTIRCDRVVGGTQEDWTGVATDIKVINGSKEVIYTNGSGTAAVGQALAANAVLRIKGVYYKVASLGTTDGFTLDRVYTGTSEEIAGGATVATAGIIGTPTGYGLKFTGLATTSFNPINESYEIVRFKIATNELYTERGVEEYLSVAAFPGSGFWKQVIEMENLFQGSDKIRYFADSMTNSRTFDTVSGNTYNILTVQLNQKPFTSATTGVSPNNPITLILAFKSTLTYDSINTALGFV